LHEFPAKAAALDGEVVASDADGPPNFVRLHVRWTRPGTIQPWAFDLLVFNGGDLRPQPLLKLSFDLHRLVRQALEQKTVAKLEWIAALSSTLILRSRRRGGSNFESDSFVVRHRMEMPAAA